MRIQLYSALVLGSALLAACQKDDLGIHEQEVFTSAYNREFTNTFGDINAGQSWDATTRALTNYESVVNPETGYYEVEETTLNWFEQNMQENKNNSRQVQAFTLTTTEAMTFEAVPLFQGEAYYKWKVEMIVNGQTAWTWEKGDGKLQHLSFAGTWKDAGILNTDNTGAMKGARSIPTQIDVPANSIIYFRIISEASGAGTHTSIERNPWIGQLSLDTPENVLSVNSSYTTMVISCEGQSITPTRKNGHTEYPDYSEAAFMLVGYVPQVVYEDQESVVTTTKRYMMEDFGTIDWDFNDVVVDVTITETATKHINTQTNEWVYTAGPTTTTTAKIAHLGGTYPVQVKVGDTTLPQISDPLNQEQTEAELAGNSSTHTYGHNGTKNDGWTPSAPAVTVTGFNSATNNVSITVWKNYDPSSPVTDAKVWTATFPEAEAKPFIVAVHSYDQWTTEGQSVKEASWWADFGK